MTFCIGAICDKGNSIIISSDGMITSRMPPIEFETKNKKISELSNKCLVLTAGDALAQADTTIAHVIGEAIGAIYNTDHGISVALTLPEAMKFNCISNFEKYANISGIMGVNILSLSIREAAFKAAGVVRDLMIDTGFPLNLQDKGVEK